MTIRFLASLGFALAFSSLVHAQTHHNTVSGPAFDSQAFTKCLKRFDGGKNGGASAKDANDVDRCYEEATPTEAKGLIGGGHTEEVIQAIINYHVPEIVKCANAERQTGRTLKGRLDTTIIVNFYAGSVEDVKFQPKTTTILSEPLRKCISDKIRAWMFPHRPDGERFTVNYPFDFTD